MKVKTVIFIAALASITTGLLAHINATKPADSAVLAEVPAVVQAGNAHCATQGTLRMYDAAITEGRMKYAESMLDRGVCAVLSHNYEALILDQRDGMILVEVALDDTEYQFWVLEGAVR